MMRKIILITDTYNGDVGFFKNEIKELSGDYEIEILSTWGEEEKVEDIGVPVSFYQKKLPLVRKIGYAFSFWGKNICRQEAKEIFKTKERVFLRLIEAIEYYANAMEFYKFFRTHFDGKDALIYCYWNTYYVLSMALHKREIGYSKLISRIHGYDLYDEVKKNGRQLFKSVNELFLDRLVFVSQKSEEYYLNRHPSFLQDKSFVNRLGVKRFEENRTVRTVNDNFLLVSCAFVGKVKRIDYLIDALEDIDVPVHWVHIGDGKKEEYNKIQSYAKEKLDTNKNVTYEFEGRLSEEQIRDFYSSNRISCFINTSKSEGSPVSIMEALAAGIPVIAPNVGEIPFMVNGNGILIPADASPEEYMGAIKEMYSIWTSTDKRFEEMSGKSLQIWEDMFDSDKNIKTMKAMIDLL